MSFGKIGKAVRTALDRSTGTGAIQRLVDKVRGQPTQSELDIQKVIGKKDEPGDMSLTVNVPEPLNDLQMQTLCDISRLRTKQKCLIRGEMPTPGLNYQSYLDTYHYQRKMYARYGAASKVDPGKIWPTPEELDEWKEKSMLQFPMDATTLFTHVEKIKAAEAQELADARARDEQVAANVLKIDEHKERLYKEAVLLDEECDKAQEKRNKRIEQVRRFFSYTISVKDPRFREKMTEMIQQEKDKLKTERKAAKKEKLETIKKQKIERL